MINTNKVRANRKQGQNIARPDSIHCHLPRDRDKDHSIYRAMVPRKEVTTSNLKPDNTVLDDNRVSMKPRCNGSIKECTCFLLYCQEGCYWEDDHFMAGGLNPSGWMDLGLWSLRRIIYVTVMAPNCKRVFCLLKHFSQNVSPKCIPFPRWLAAPIPFYGKQRLHCCSAHSWVLGAKQI